VLEASTPWPWPRTPWPCRGPWSTSAAGPY
jgi:hypothetical protein